MEMENILSGSVVEGNSLGEYVEGFRTDILSGSVSKVLCCGGTFSGCGRFHSVKEHLGNV